MSQFALKNVRLSFPDIFTASEKFGNYGAQLIISNKADVAKIEAEMLRVATEKWGAKGEAYLKSAKAANKVCLKDGDTKAEFDGYAGNMILSANNSQRPPVVNRDRSPITEADGIVYSGCYVNAIVKIWAQDNSFGKRINASLDGIQFFKDGENFGGGGVASPDMFDDLSDGADDGFDDEDSLV